MTDITQRFILGARQPERFIHRSAHNVRDISRFDIETHSGMWLKDSFHESGVAAEAWVIVVQTRDGARTELFSGASSDTASIVLDRILSKIVAFDGTNIDLLHLAGDFLIRTAAAPAPQALVA